MPQRGVGEDPRYPLGEYEQKRDQFSGGELPNVPSVAESDRCEEPSGRFCGGEHRQHLLTQMGKGMRKLEARNLTASYNVVNQALMSGRKPRGLPTYSLLHYSMTLHFSQS